MEEDRFNLIGTFWILLILTCDLAIYHSRLPTIFFVLSRVARRPRFPPKSSIIFHVWSFLHIITLTKKENITEPWWKKILVYFGHFKLAVFFSILNKGWFISKYLGGGGISNIRSLNQDLVVQGTRGVEISYPKNLQGRFNGRVWTCIEGVYRS